MARLLPSEDTINGRIWFTEWSPSDRLPGHCHVLLQQPQSVFSTACQLERLRSDLELTKPIDQQPSGWILVSKSPPACPLDNLFCLHPAHWLSRVSTWRSNCKVDIKSEKWLVLIVVRSHSWFCLESDLQMYSRTLIAEAKGVNFYCLQLLLLFRNARFKTYDKFSVFWFLLRIES